MSANELVASVKAISSARLDLTGLELEAPAPYGVSAVARPKHAARRMGMSDATFWRKVKEGKIKVTKISERITVVAESEIQAMLAGERA